MPPRTLPGSIERHREVCRKNGSSSTGSSTDSSSGSNASSSPCGEEDDNTKGVGHGGGGGGDMLDGCPSRDPLMAGGLHPLPLRHSASQSQLMHQQELLSRSPPTSTLNVVMKSSTMANMIFVAGVATNQAVIPPHKHSIHTNTRSAKRISAAASNSNNNNNINNSSSNSSGNNNNRNSSNGHSANGGHKKKSNKNFLPSEDSEEDFSDDSLEDTSLPPPPPPPVVPPPPSLSCPVTPSKRGSIAWEINLDDPLDEKVKASTGTGPTNQQTPPPPLGSAKVSVRCGKWIRDQLDIL